MLKSHLILLTIFLFANHVLSRGKTYDDLEEILRHEGLSSMKTHVTLQPSMDEGSKIDQSKVVHVKKPEI